MRRIYTREELVGALAGAMIAGLDKDTLLNLAAVFTIQWVEVLEVLVAVGQMIEGEAEKA